LKSLEHFLKPDFYSELRKNSDIFSELRSLRSSCNNEYEELTLSYLKNYLPSLFTIEDKLSMAFSLESRTPLCDNEMVDFALSIPLSAKLRGYELKHIPRRAMKEKLPRFIYRLPKKGFPTPLRHWFKKELKDYIRSFVCDNITAIPMFNRKAVEKMLEEYQRSETSSLFDEITAHKIWIIFNLIHYFTNQNRRYNVVLEN
jgi:asparagine synthase (glutamine-hydrolysing)